MHPVFVESSWRGEALRTNLWLVPTIEVIGAVVLFAATLALDEAAYRGRFALPPWVVNGTTDAARQILATLAAAVITVVGVVFSIIIVALTLTSTQFGPRMLFPFRICAGRGGGASTARAVVVNVVVNTEGVPGKSRRQRRVMPAWGDAARSCHSRLAPHEPLRQ
jgi:hypothetical protein